MKTKLLFILIILFCSCGPKIGTKKTINIVSWRNFELNGALFHRDKEVIVYILDYAATKEKESSKASYAIYIYLKGRGQEPDFSFEADRIFDKAEYEWVNDTTYKIRLLDSSNKLYTNGAWEHHLSKKWLTESDK